MSYSLAPLQLAGFFFFSLLLIFFLSFFVFPLSCTRFFFFFVSLTRKRSLTEVMTRRWFKTSVENWPPPPPWWHFERNVSVSLRVSSISVLAGFWPSAASLPEMPRPSAVTPKVGFALELKGKNVVALFIPPLRDADHRELWWNVNWRRQPFTKWYVDTSDDAIDQCL